MPLLRRGFGDPVGGRTRGIVSVLRRANGVPNACSIRSLSNDDSSDPHRCRSAASFAELLAARRRERHMHVDDVPRQPITEAATGAGGQAVVVDLLDPFA